MIAANDVAIEAWNTVLFDKWERFRHLVTQGLSVHSDAVLTQWPYRRGQRVIDIGCGYGDTALEIAAAVGPSGSVVGVDCAPRFVARAEERARHAGQGNVGFLVADVQRSDLGGPYDAAFSRFGTMFFASPGAAMRNVRRALRSGAELTQIVWRRREDNPWLYEAEQCVRDLVPVVSHDETDQVHCGPGPFSMAGPDLVSDLLRSAGFAQIRFERFDADICIGHTLEDAVAFATALGPAGEIMRLAGEAGARLRETVEAALRATLSVYARDDGTVWAPSSTWIVRATNPG